jgi:hypothetical protein
VPALALGHKAHFFAHRPVRPQPSDCCVGRAKSPEYRFQSALPLTGDALPDRPGRRLARPPRLDTAHSADARPATDRFIAWLQGLRPAPTRGSGLAVDPTSRCHARAGTSCPGPCRRYSPNVAAPRATPANSRHGLFLDRVRGRTAGSSPGTPHA